MKRYFVTATGTDIGKTLVTAALTWQLRNSGVKVRALKPIASGFNELEQSDTASLLAAQGMTLADIDLISPWRFTAPLSPDMAAKAEGRNINLEEVVQFCNAPTEADIMLIEGIGGVMTPINEQHTVLDWIKKLDIPVILVAGSYVGTLSHTLTALSVLRSRSLHIHSILISESADSAATPQQTLETLQQHTANTIDIRTLRRLNCTQEMWKDAPTLIEGFI